jgi:Icc-related predicted phosphoesterase
LKNQPGVWFKLRRMKRFNRREALKIGAGALLSAGLAPGQLRAQENGKGDGDWKFIAVNDLHFFDDKCAPWFEKAIAAMKASAPDADFYLLGGDLANDGKRAQLAGVRDAFKALNKPIFAVPGNHDWFSNTDRKAYDELFAGQLNQVFEHRGWQIIGLDTTNGTRYEKTTIQKSTFDWLDATLPKLDKAKPTILWTHFPLGEGVTYRPQNADALLEKFLDFNLRAAFCGHWHGFSEKKWRGAILTTDRCCARVRGNADGSPKKGWFVCTAKNGSIEREFVEVPTELRV